MEKPYQIVTRPSKGTSRERAALLPEGSQRLLPLVELVEC